ncbi:MAG TPA: dockerin type I domain-containing protein [Tepidisphaeraceae bacterium]|nr:dockerin type I domain-containing protein [Tepidisphaeraceae bacterium]
MKMSFVPPHLGRVHSRAATGPIGKIARGGKDRRPPLFAIEAIEQRLLLSATAILSGQTLAGTIQNPAQQSTYSFSATAGNSFELSLGDASAASALQPDLQVFAPNGTRVGNTFSYATNTSVNVFYNVPAAIAGTYTAIVQDATGTNVGAYDLELAVAPATQSPDSDGDGGPIVSGQSKAGTINRTGDLDVFTFSALAGNTIDVTLGDASAASQLDPYLQVFAPDGTRVGNAFNYATNTSVSVIYNVPSTSGGTFTIVAQDAVGTHTGAYNLKLAVAPATQAADPDGDSGPIASGQTKAGTINWTGDLDVYTFTAAAGNTFDLSLGDAGATSQLQPYLQVFGPDGTRVGNTFNYATNTSVNVIYNVPSADGGTYTVVVQDAVGNHLGAYDLELAVAPATQAPDSDGDGGPIVSGQTKAGTINRTGDLDVFTFTAAAGNTFDLSLGDPDAASQLQPYLQVFGPNGTRVGNTFNYATNTSVSVIYTVPSADGGTYTAVVQDAVGNHVGSYDLELAVAPATQAPDSDGDGGPIVSGQTKAGAINRTGDLDVFTFTAAAGNTFDLSLGDPDSTSQLQPYLQVFGPNGTRVGNTFSYATNTSVSVIYNVPNADGGTYTAVVQDAVGNHVGAYDLELAVAPATQAPDSDGDGGPIVSGQTKAGTINRTGDLDVFTFSALAGNTIDVSLGDASAASQLEPYLQVFAPDGTRVGNTFTYATNTSVSVIYNVPSTSGGTFTIVAQDTVGTHTGAYNLKLAVAPATQAADPDGDSGPIASGQTKAGTINWTGDLDVYTFTAAAGNSFDMSLGDPDATSQLQPYLQVFGPNGTRVGNTFSYATNTSVSVIYNVPSTGGGTYTAVVQDTVGGHLGAYDLELAVAPATQAPDSDGDGGPIGYGQPATGTINRTGDLDVFTFSAIGGNIIGVTLGDASAASQVEPYLQVFAPDGTRVGNTYSYATNTSVNVTYSVPADSGGTYTIVAQDTTGGHTGAYVLGVTVQIPAPVVTFNDGAASQGAVGQTQRSEVRNMILSFNQPVQLSAASLSLSLLNTGGSGLNNGSAPTPLAASVMASATSPDGGATWIIAIADSSANSDSTGSLKDGIYSLVINSAALTGPNSATSLIGGNKTTTFHRLFGDINGDGTVNLTDYRAFKATYLSSAGNPGFVADFDANNDGTINLVDYRAFKNNYLKQFTN